VVLFLFDAQAGLTPADLDILRKLKQSGLGSGDRAPIIGVVNKVDAESHEVLDADFYEAGLDSLLTISAEHNRGIEDLKETVIEITGAATETSAMAEDEDNDSDVPSKIPRVAIVGRPNVGKSTLTNALLGERRMITSSMAGTTVDSVDSLAEVNGIQLILIDTAGIRRKSKTEQGVEVLSVIQARKALERCDVAVLLMDGEQGVTDQDEKIGGLIDEVGCGVILAVNKWDVQRRNPKFKKDDAASIVRERMAYLSYAPILFVSAIKGEGFEDLGNLVEEILRQRQVKVSTHEFSEWVREEVTIHNPKNAKFYLSHQTGRNPPTFVCHVSDPDKVHFSLRRHLINAIRERWGFMGSPVRLVLRAGAGGKDRAKPSPSKHKRGRKTEKHPGKV
jgi:GTP-binding protein